MPKPLDKRERNRELNRQRRLREPWQAWYSSPRWRAIRAQQLSAHPLCSRCSTDTHPVAATVCHHVERHQGNPEKFWHGAVASVCKACHDRDEQALEKGGQARQVVGIDGWPIE